MRIPFSWLVLVLLLIFPTASACGKTWTLAVSDNHRFLQTTDGKPFFWLGDTGWLLPERLDRAGVRRYLRHCRQDGFNVVQMQVLNAVSSVNVYGQKSNPNGFDMSAADHSGVYSYWDHLDYIVKTARRNGIYVAMVPVWGSIVKSGKMGVDDAVSYGRFLANRYKDCPNIIWMIGGDIQGDVHPEVWEALATTIKSVDHQHLMTYHPRGRYTSARWWSRAAWIDFHVFQSGHRRYGQSMGSKDYPIPDGTEEDNWMYVDSTWAYKPLEPVLDAEPSYEHIPQGLHDPNEPRWQACDVRRYAYWSVFAGSCGHTYGHNSVMQMLRPGDHSGYGTDGEEPYWYDALAAPGRNQMRYVKALMLAFPYFCRIPDQSIIVGENGKRYDRLIATRGNDYLLLYDYRHAPITVDLTRISGTKKNAWWMDAATGNLQYLGQYANGIVTFPSDRLPGDGDGVLICVDASKHYIGLKQKNIKKGAGSSRGSTTPV